MQEDHPAPQGANHHFTTLLGGVPATPTLLNRALAIAPRVVAADGGANWVRDLGIDINHIIGDLDSIDYPEYWEKLGTKLSHIREQSTTDFEKCLYTEQAELYLGLGFVGGRLDHTLAALRTLAVYPQKRVVLISEEDITFLCPMKFALDLPQGTRVSFFPFSEITAGPSEGLHWPLEGLQFAPDGMIGTSNAATGGRIAVSFDRPGMLMILPLDCLETVVAALIALPAVPAK